MTEQATTTSAISGPERPTWACGDAKVRLVATGAPEERPVYLAGRCPRQSCRACNQPGVYYLAGFAAGLHLSLPFPGRPTRRGVPAYVGHDEVVEFLVTCNDIRQHPPFLLRCSTRGELTADHATSGTQPDGIIDTSTGALVHALTGTSDLGVLLGNHVRSSLAATSILAFAAEQHAEAWAATSGVRGLVRRLWPDREAGSVK